MKQGTSRVALAAQLGALVMALTGGLDAEVIAVLAAVLGLLQSRLEPVTLKAQADKIAKTGLLIIMVLGSVGCAHVCAGDEAVVATFTAGPPSRLTGRCSGDPADKVRRDIRGRGKGVFQVACPEGKVPGYGAACGDGCRVATCVTQ